MEIERKETQTFKPILDPLSLKPNPFLHHSDLLERAPFPLCDQFLPVFAFRGVHHAENLYPPELYPIFRGCLLS